jgi:hypothetical protein
MARLVMAMCVCLLLGCANHAVYQSWVGRSLNDLQFAWGPPNRSTQLSDGRSMVAYQHTQFVAGIDGFCTITFAADRAGTIVDASATGNNAGCNAMLRMKRPAQ